MGRTSGSGHMGHASKAGHHPKLPKTARNGRLAVERLPGATASATVGIRAPTCYTRLYICDQ